MTENNNNNNDNNNDNNNKYPNNMHVDVYDGCGIVALIYWPRLKQYL